MGNGINETRSDESLGITPLEVSRYDIPRISTEVLINENIYQLEGVYNYDLEDNGFDPHKLSQEMNEGMYDGAHSTGRIKELFFDNPEIYNFILKDGDNIPLVMQIIDIPKIHAKYLFAIEVSKNYREKGFSKFMINNYLLDINRSLIGLRSLNPILISSLVKNHGFKLPTHMTKQEKQDYLKKSKEILISVEGFDLGIQDNFIIPNGHTSNYPSYPEMPKSKNTEVREFMKENMKPNDKLFMVRTLP
jgi:hypothetical protein